MKIIEPKATLWNYDDVTDHIARCARICYASDNTKNNDKFTNALKANKHLSMFRHAGAYFIIPCKIDVSYKAFIDATVYLIEDKYYISTNEQAAIEYFRPKYAQYEISKKEAENVAIFWNYKMIRYTFCIETGIDITREYNRKSPNNIAEQSTRYVDFNKKLGIRFKKCHWMNGLNLYKRCLVKIMCKTIEWFYKLSRSKYGLNLLPQDARWILALDVMSKAIYTYTVADWEFIINLRLFDYTGIAHTDAKIIAKQIKKQLEDEGYNIIKY